MSSARGPRRAGRWTTGPARWPMGEFDFGFAVEWMRKDLGICLEEAERNGARLPVTAAVDQMYKQIDRSRRRALGHEQPDRPAAQRLTRSAGGDGQRMCSLAKENTPWSCENSIVLPSGSRTMHT